jgi:hypothetical protein
MLQRLPFANGERFDMMWGCCAGTHASSVWQNNGNDYYAGAGTKCVAPIDGTVVRAGVPGIGQGERVGIQGKTHSVYMAHMHRLRVREGQQVKAGDPVGEIWPFPGMPDHLHFSVAVGSYASGKFVDPWNAVRAMAKHIGGRTYEATGPGPAPKPPAPSKGKFYVEEMPAKAGGQGPDVYGPWRDTPGHRENRAERMMSMRESGRAVVAMSDKRGDLYIYEFPKGRYGKPYRWGPWSTPQAAEKAQAALVKDGRATSPRRFSGPANSLYPWI